MLRIRIASRVLAIALVLAFPAAAAGALDPLRLGFDTPSQVSQGPAYQAAEPSIRVDAAHPLQRIWIAAPSGIGVDTRSLPASPVEAGDLLWYSDDHGYSWPYVTGPEGVGSPTIVGGGDSDVATAFGPQVYATGLTLANITLAASCAEGADGTFTFNPISVLSPADDRQWIDTYEDHPAPPGAPAFVLTYGNIGAGEILFNQVASPGCGPPVGGPIIDASALDCQIGPDCYQWPGNVAVDETFGDAYVTYNTQGDPDNDDIIVTRIDGGASRLSTQSDVVRFVAASHRPDTFDSFTVVAVDRAGNVYVVWSERQPATQTTDTMLAVSRNRGATWTQPVKVNSGAKTTTFPWIVAGDAGKIDVVYYGTSATGPSPEEVPAKSKWKVFMSQSLNALDASPTFKESAATGYMHQGSICTSGTGCATGTRDLLDFFQVDVDARGLANIAYTDNLNGPPDGSDPHQELIYFVKQQGGKALFGK
jgi:hypothetical protein